MKKIICFTNKSDSEELKEYNEYGFKLEFFDSFEELPESEFYIVSLKMGSNIYSKFVIFMRDRPKSKFIFLNEYTEPLNDEDFIIRDEKNTESYMYVPSAALFRIKEFVSVHNVSTL
jgi:hypothetical protein